MNIFAKLSFGNRRRRWAAVAISVFSVAALQGFTILEPATVFYGKVIGTGGSRPFLVTDGTLEWTIDRADGGEVTLQTALYPLNDGEFSYRMNVPHDVLGIGLSKTSLRISLGAVEETHTVHRIMVNDLPARIVGGDGSFDASQATRAATYRVDIEVALIPVDSDGDGLPDWWEDEHGLDKQDSADADHDADGDGLTSGQEFNGDSDPNQDGRQPLLVTTELLAYPGGTTGLMLKSQDSDSTADQLLYTLIEPPVDGGLFLRNGREDAESADQRLEMGAQFTQMDIQNGRVIFLDGDGTGTPQSFSVQVEDEDPAHAVDSGRVEIKFYQPSPGIMDSISGDGGIAVAVENRRLPGVSETEDLRVKNYLLSREAGYIIWDGSGDLVDQVMSAPSAGLEPGTYETGYMSRYGRDRDQVFLGGAGADVLVGGMEKDVLAGGPGDDQLRGNQGRDRFVFHLNSGNDTILDFNTAEGDIIDLTLALNGRSTRLADYVAVSESEDGLTLEIDTDADGREDNVIRLSGYVSAGTNLRSLVDSGSLVANGFYVTTSVTVVATRAIASENGPQAGEFSVVRSGSVEAALVVNLSVRGSAENGVDYPTLPSQVTIPAGQTSAKIVVSPYPDAATELAETVELILLPGEDYEMGATQRVSLVIEDLAPLIAVEVLEAVGERASQQPAMLAIHRSGVLDRDVLVRLEIGGSASAGQDYEPVSAFINLAARQTVHLIEIRPLVSGSGEEDVQRPSGSVVVTVLPDPNQRYRVSDQGIGRVWIVDRSMRFAAWRTKHFPGATGSLVNEMHPRLKIRNLHAYAFGIDPDAELVNGKPAGLPEFRVVDTHLEVRFRRPAEVTDVTYLVEVCEELGSWRSGAGHVVSVSLAESEENAEMSCYRAVGSMSERPIQFMRVRATLKP